MMLTLFPRLNYTIYMQKSLSGAKVQLCIPTESLSLYGEFELFSVDSCPDFIKNLVSKKFFSAMSGKDVGA